MAVAEEMGHDHQGKEIYRWDLKQNKINKNELWDDIPLIINEINRNKNEKYSFKVKSSIANENQIYVPRYYWETRDKEIARLADETNIELVPVQTLIEKKIIGYFDGHGSPEAENKGRGEIPYIRVSDIVNWELYKDPTSMVPEEIYNQFISEKKILREKDILYVRRGSYRIGGVAMVSPFDTKVLLTREILVLRVLNEKNEYNLDPYYLLYLFSHKLASMQTYNKVLIETTLPNIADRWKEIKLPIHKDVKKRKEISEKMKSVTENKWEAMKKIEELRSELGGLTT